MPRYVGIVVPLKTGTHNTVHRSPLTVHRSPLQWVSLHRFAPERAFAKAR